MSDQDVYLDPDGAREIADIARPTAQTFLASAERVEILLGNVGLVSAAPTLLREAAEETSLLAQYCVLKAQQIEAADSGWISMALWENSVSGAAATLRELLASLNDDVGASALGGDNAIAAVLGDFAVIDTDGDGQIGVNELAVAAEGGNRAAQYLLNNPTLLTNISMALTPLSSRRDGGDLLVISAELLQATLQQNEALRVLGDRTFFDQIEALKTGEADGVLSLDDINLALENADLDPNQRAALMFMASNEVFWSRLDVAYDFARSEFDFGDLSLHDALGVATSVLAGADGRLSFDDIIALSVNQQAYAADSAAATMFLGGLPKTWTELNGKTIGVDMHMLSDDGVQALAVSALSGADTLLEQVTVVASLPESHGGVRNNLINFYYSIMAEQMDLRINGPILNPGDYGHAGANWMHYGTGASYSVRDALIGEARVKLNHPSLNDRQHLADGNQYIFGDVGVRWALYLEEFPAGGEITGEDINDYFKKTLDPNLEGEFLFRDGHNQLRDSFAFLLAAQQETDPQLRQEYMLQANILMGNHEQAGIQNYLHDVIDQSIDDDGWFRGTVGEVGSWLVSGGSDEELATDNMRLKLGVVVQDDGDLVSRYEIEVEKDLQPVTGEAARGNLVSEADLVADFNPDEARTVSVDGLEIGLQGHSGDVVLDDINGWQHPSDESGMDKFETDAESWAENGSSHGGDADWDGYEGTGAKNWADANQRMLSIGIIFRDHQSDPLLWQTVDDLAQGGDWHDQQLGYLNDAGVAIGQ